MRGNARSAPADAPPRAPHHIAIVYLAAAIAWILLSDRIVELFVSPQQLAAAQTYKGLAYVLLTGALLFELLRRHHRRVVTLHNRILRRQEAYRARLESLPVAVFTVRRGPAGENTVYWANRLARSMCNLPAPADNRADHDDQPGPRLDDLLEPDSRATVARLLESARARGGAHSSDHIVFDAPGARPVICVLSAIRSGAADAVELAAADITEHVRLEEELRRTEQLAVVGKFVATVAHDLNNMITAVAGYTSLAHEQLPEEHPAANTIGQVTAAASQADGLVRSLLTFSRGFSAPKRPGELRDIVGEAIDAARPLLAPNINLEAIIEGPAPLTVSCDRIQLQRAVINLITNARDAMPDGGTITLALAREDDTARIEVIDEGVGIPDSVIDHIFEPFFTTKTGEKGTGLGLAIVGGILKDHGGAVSVQSRPGRTVFTLRIPLIEPPPAMAMPAAPRAALIAEDHQLIAGLVARVLAASGWTVGTATAATQLAADPGEAIDLIVMDQDLPGGPGVDALAIIRSLGREPAMILVTGGLAPDAAELGNAVLLSKPFTPDQLLAAVSAASGVRSAAG